jgi:hypothetical protein
MVGNSCCDEKQHNHFHPSRLFHASVFKMKRAWTPRLSPKTFDVNHFVSLSLERAAEEDGEGPSERVLYHKDQWNEKDYSHGGLGKILKTINGDTATVMTRPPKDL